MTWRPTLKWIMDMCGKYKAAVNLPSTLDGRYIWTLTLALHISQDSPKKTCRTYSVSALWWLSIIISLLLHLFIHWEGKCMTRFAHGGQRTSYSSADSFLLPCRSQGLNSGPLRIPSSLSGQVKVDVFSSICPLSRATQLVTDISFIYQFIYYLLFWEWSLGLQIH